MPVVKSIVSKNEFHAVQKEVIPVASEATADHIMYVESQLESDFIEKLRALDLEPIIFLLTHPKKSLGWSRDKALQAIAHYKMFLLLHNLYPDKNIVPTEEIDRVFEQHFSDSAKYHQDCNHLFGYFLHHDPYFGLLNEADEKSHLAAFMETKVLFKKHFGIELLINPSRCQPLKQPKQIRPCVANIQPWNLMKCG
jgi:hypothetical protein